MRRLFSCLIPLVLLACQSKPKIQCPIDLVLVGGRIETMDESLGEVEALAISDGRVLAVGSDEQIRALIDESTHVIELDGRRAIPGFIEGHAHFLNMGNAMQILELRDVQNWDEVISMVREAVGEAQPGEWILGRGWHQEKWDRVPPNAVAGFPSHEALSAISPDNPVCLKHASGHACFFNAKAMGMAGVTSETPDPAGGEILHMADGEPSGVFSEKASSLVDAVRAREMARKSPEEREQGIRRALKLADRECLSKGVTSFQDAGTSLEHLGVIREVVEEGGIGVRLWMMVRDRNDLMRAGLADSMLEGFGDNHLTIKAVKRSLDGALGSRGAWLHEPYSDLPSTSGLNTASLESVEESARIAAEAGFQLCVHAIGDRANSETLDLFERVLADYPELREDHRWRIEHAQHLVPADIPRFAELGVVASMQGVHCTSDAPYVVPRLGEARAESGAYMWRALTEAGVLVSNGTDAPVEDVDPIASYYATVSRRMKSGETFYPDQRLSRLEALRTYTINCAKAAFEEHLKGSLQPGKLADVVVLSKDILTVPEEEIPEARVLMTIVGGELLYEAPLR